MRTRRVALRLPQDHVARVDALVEALRAERPGFKMPKAAVWRFIIARGLDDLEQSSAGTRRLHEAVASEAIPPGPTPTSEQRRAARRPR